MGETMNNMGSIASMWYFAVIPLVFIAYGFFMVFKMKNDKSRVASWLTQNPNAVKVFINKKTSAVKVMANAMNTLKIISVDDDYPLLFTEKLHTGFYLTPGTHIIESTFSKTRPGIFYRQVSTTYGPSKQEINVEANKTYNYSFNTKEETYMLEILDE